MSSNKLSGFDQLAALTGRPAPEKQPNQADADQELVYSTEHGRIRQPKQKANAPVGDGIVRVSRERKGRGGKTVTVITGLPLASGELNKLAKSLKQRAGGGGSVKSGEIVLQGDHRELMVSLLREQGFDAKSSGG